MGIDTDQTQVDFPTRPHGVLHSPPTVSLCDLPSPTHVSVHVVRTYHICHRYPVRTADTVYGLKR